jgi:ribosomal protein S18 acetylase RimI-like enzyme
VRSVRTAQQVGYDVESLAWRPVEGADVALLSALVHRVLQPYTLPGWSPHAIARLLEENSEASLRQSLDHAAFAHLCLDAGTVVGFVTNKVPGLVSLLLVDPSHQRRGIGSHLLEVMLEYVAVAAPELGIVEVNATEYSLPFYRRFGFYPISEFIEFDGCRFARLAYWRKNPLSRR